MSWQSIIRDSDFHFALNVAVFVYESEAVERRDFWQCDDESGFAFLKRAAEGVTRS